MRLIILTLSLALGCTPAPQKVWVDIDPGPIEFSTETTVFHLPEPAPTDNDIVGVCVQPPSGYLLTPDWSIATQQGEDAALGAHVVLTDRSTVVLDGKSQMGTLFCLEKPGPLPAAVVDVSVSSTSPLTVTSVQWMSTAK